MVPPGGNEDDDVKLMVTGTEDSPTRRFCNFMLNATEEI